MSDGPPNNEDRTVSTYLDYLALACIFGIVEALSVSRWWLALGMLVASLVFHNVGVKWPRIKSKTATLFDWQLWGKRIAVAVRVLVVLSVLALVLTGYYVKRTLFGSHKTQTSSSQEQVPKPQNAPSSPLTAAPAKPPALARHLNWHDKENWRRNLHTGMTRTEVRQVFGEPEKMSVVSTMEFWDYGSGNIEFDMEGHPDGSLYLWSEP